MILKFYVFGRNGCFVLTPMVFKDDFKVFVDTSRVAITFESLRLMMNAEGYKE